MEVIGNGESVGCKRISPASRREAKAAARQWHSNKSFLLADCLGDPTLESKKPQGRWLNGTVLRSES